MLAFRCTDYWIVNVALSLRNSGAASLLLHLFGNFGRLSRRQSSIIDKSILHLTAIVVPVNRCLGGSIRQAHAAGEAWSDNKCRTDGCAAALAHWLDSSE